jgi:hypothetical protein
MISHLSNNIISYIFNFSVCRLKKYVSHVNLREFSRYNYCQIYVRTQFKRVISVSRLKLPKSHAILVLSLTTLNMTQMPK